MPIDIAGLKIDLLQLGPEIFLAVTAIAVILLDLVVREKRLLAWASAVGTVVSALAVLPFWNTQDTSFSQVFLVDQFALFFKLLFLGVTFLVLLASQDYVARFPRFQGEYYGLILLATVGMMLLVSMGELISIYVSLELQTFALVALATFLKDARSMESGLKFLVVGAISSALMLYGMALLYGMAGTTFLTGIAETAAEAVSAGSAPDNLVLLLAAILLIAGFGFKVASVPFQMWAPDVYEGSPTPIVAYLSVASKAAGFAVLLRVFYVVFGEIGLEWLNWRMLIATLAIVSMTFGNIVAISQANLKRLLGYSTIAHAGYILVGVAAVSDLGRSGVLFYLLAYAVTNLGAFIGIIALANRVGSERIDDFAGMGRQAPFLAFALGLCLVSLTGLPPTAGFMGKIYIFNAAVQDGLWWLALAGVINTFISAYYYLRPIRVMYLNPAQVEAGVPASMALRASLVVSMAGVLLLGVLPERAISFATAAVEIFGP